MKKYNDLFVWVQLALERCIKLVQKSFAYCEPSPFASAAMLQLPCRAHTTHGGKTIISSAETVLGWKPNICKCTNLLLCINPNPLKSNTWCAGIQMSVCKLHHAKIGCQNERNKVKTWSHKHNSADMFSLTYGSYSKICIGTRVVVACHNQCFLRPAWSTNQTQYPLTENLSRYLVALKLVCVQPYASYLFLFKIYQANHANPTCPKPPSILC